MRPRPHLYHLRGAWFCRFDFCGVRRLGPPRASPLLAYEALREIYGNGFLIPAMDPESPALWKRAPAAATHFNAYTQQFYLQGSDRRWYVWARGFADQYGWVPAPSAWMTIYMKPRPEAFREPV